VAKKTKSGIGYKVLKPGTGAKPKSTDTVEVHYHGTLIDGKVFDSSVDRKKKISFPLNRVIKCWTEGMQLVGVGGKIRLVCPSDLAYGDQGAPPKIPGGSTLVFDVELFSIKDDAKKVSQKSPKKPSNKKKN
jgi:FKBP-type peptidyl-prolyl cis-trans isomerase FkpA